MRTARRMAFCKSHSRRRIFASFLRIPKCTNWVSCQRSLLTDTNCLQLLKLLETLCARLESAFGEGRYCRGRDDLSSEERRKAGSVDIQHQGTSRVFLGNVHAESVQIGDYNSYSCRPEAAGCSSGPTNGTRVNSDKLHPRPQPKTASRLTQTRTGLVEPELRLDWPAVGSY